MELRKAKELVADWKKYSYPQRIMTAEVRVAHEIVKNGSFDTVSKKLKSEYNKLIAMAPDSNICVERRYTFQFASTPGQLESTYPRTIPAKIVKRFPQLYSR